MKNRSIITIVSLVLLVTVLGCSWWNPLASKPENTKSNTAANKDTKASPETKEKTLEEKAIDSTVGDEKIGVQECDDLMDSIAEESKSEDEGTFAKATRGYIMSKIRESIKKSIEENKGDKEKMAKECKDLKVQFDKAKEEEKNKNK